MHTLLEMGLGNALTAGAVALVAFAVSRGCRRRPAFVHCLWLVVFLKLLTPPVFGVRLPWSLAWQPEPAALTESGAQPLTPEPPSEPRSGPEVVLLPAEEAPPVLEPEPPPLASDVDSPEPLPLPTTSLSWEEVAELVWLSGSLLWFGWMALHIYRFRRVLRWAWLAPPNVQQQAADLAARLGLRHCPPVWLVPGSVSPMLWAAGWSARLLFPVGLLDRLDDEQRASVLAHELAHLRRRDHWVRLLELAAIGLYWWHPAVWWARHELREAEEQCCDAWAVWALEGAGRPYALALLQTVEFFSSSRAELPIVASGIGTVSHLRRRLIMIVQGTTPRSLSRLGGLAALGLGTLLMLPTLPLDAQPPPPDKLGNPPAEDRDLQDRQQKLQAELQKVQAEMKTRDTQRKVKSRVEVQVINDYFTQLKGNGGKLPTEVREALAELEKARANLGAAEKKLREALTRMGGQDIPAGVIRVAPGNRAGVYRNRIEIKSAEPTAAERKVLEIKRDNPSAQERKVLAIKRGEAGSQEERLRVLEKRLEELQRTIERMDRQQRRRGAADEALPKLAPRGGANS